MPRLICKNEFNIIEGKCEEDCSDCMGYYIDQGCHTCVKAALKVPKEFGYDDSEMRLVWEQDKCRY